MTYRNIDTTIWKDGWFLELEPNEKLLFVYLFSNEQTLLTGLYKISLKVIEFETGLDRDFILTSLAKFEHDKKVFYDNGIIFVINLKKYNASRSPKVAARIVWELNQIPDCRLKTMYLSGSNTLPNQDNSVPIEYGYGIDTSPTLTNQSKPLTNQTNATGEVFTHFQNEITLLTPVLSETVGGWIDDYPKEWIIEAINIAVERSARNAAYISAILKRWKEDGKDNGHKPAQPKQKTMEEQGYQRIE